MRFHSSAGIRARALAESQNLTIWGKSKRDGLGFSWGSTHNTRQKFAMPVFVGHGSIGIKLFHGGKLEESCEK